MHKTYYGKGGFINRVQRDFVKSFSGNKGIPHSIVGIKGTVIYFQLKFPLLLNRR